MSMKDDCLFFIKTSIEDFEDYCMPERARNQSLLLSGYLRAMKDMKILDDREYMELCAAVDHACGKAMDRMREEDLRRDHV